MKHHNLFIFCVAALLMSQLFPSVDASGVRLKDLARFEGVRNNSVVGYGLVVGLAGSGDSSRNKATIQSLANTLNTFGLIVNDKDISSRNVAAVMITAELPAFAERGDKIDVNVSSMGDAKSLLGGTLLMVPLKAANGDIYALAQGPLSVGGFKYDMFGNVVQKNHPTVGAIPNGATIERAISSQLVNQFGEINLILNEPDFTTAERIVQAISRQLPGIEVEPIHAGKVAINTQHLTRGGRFKLYSRLEKMTVQPDTVARVVINERTGTVVAGGNVRVNDVTISHGELRLEIKTNFDVSQPFFLGRNNSENISTTVTPNTDIKVTEKPAQAIALKSGTSVNELISSLRQLKTSTRDVIIILQSIKRAGALHADLIIQ